MFCCYWTGAFQTVCFGLTARSEEKAWVCHIQMPDKWVLIRETMMRLQEGVERGQRWRTGCQPSGSNGARRPAGSPAARVSWGPRARRGSGLGLELGKCPRESLPKGRGEIEACTSICLQFHLVYRLSKREMSLDLTIPSVLTKVCSGLFKLLVSDTKKDHGELLHVFLNLRDNSYSPFFWEYIKE